jgi:flagellar protein FlaG
VDVKLNTSGAAPAAPATTRAKADPGGKVLPEGGQSVPAAKEPPPDPARVEQAIRQIQSYLADTQRELQMQVDKSTGRTIVRVVNPQTQELIRQIPSEEALKLAAAIGTGGGQVFSELA